MAKVVIDANVIISAAYGGKPLEAVTQALEKHEVFLSESIRQELEQTFVKLSRKLSNEQIIFIREKVRQILAKAKCVTVSASVALSRDAADDHYLGLCKEAKADFLITGDKDLLSISREDLRKHGVCCLILTPGSFLESVF
jgi:putative PIN family toxin of toxin-antitoxin system